MKQRGILFVIALIACLGVSACSLKVPNIEWCRDKGSLGAFCAQTNNELERELTEAEWRELRFGWFCTDEEGFAKNQEFIEKACEKVKGCDIEELRREYLELIRRY